MIPEAERRMAEVLFYHLTESKLEEALPPLLEKSVERGWKVAVQTRDGVRRVHARRAEGAERDRLWARWGEIDAHLDAYAARRPQETAVVVFEPRSAEG